MRTGEIFSADHQEKESRFPLKTLVVLGSLWAISTLAFSLKTRKKIGQRDNWTCQAGGCDDGNGEAKSYQNGWMVHAAHKPEHHLKTDPIYDEPEAGDIRCIDHHLEQHEGGTVLPKCQNDFAIMQLKRTQKRTKWWLQQNGG